VAECHLILTKWIFYIFALIQLEFFPQGCFKPYGTGTDNFINCVYYDSILDKIVLHGSFSYADGKLVKGMATWDGTNFDSLGSGNKFSVPYKPSFMIRYHNKLYTQFDDKYLYSYDYGTKNWQKIPYSIYGEIRDACIYNDKLILAGQFGGVGGVPVKNIVQFNGVSFDTLPKPWFTMLIWAVREYKGELYIGGDFDGNANPPSNGIAKFNGTAWVAASPGVDIVGGGVVSLEKYNGKLFLSGGFNTINGDYSPGIASWDGQKWNNIGGIKFNNGIPGYAVKMRVIDSKLYLNGAFDSVGGKIASRNFAVWNDTAWCGTAYHFNQAIDPIKYKGKWHVYTPGPWIIYCDTVEQVMESPTYTIASNFSEFIGNNGKIERDCYKVPPKIETATGIYPNPFNETINVSLPSDFNFSNSSVSVFDYLGRQVYELKFLKAKQEIDLSFLSSGFYYLKTQGDSGRKVFKILKE